MRRAPERYVKVELADRALILRPRGTWKLWSFCWRKTVPYGAILAAKVSSAPEDSLRPRWRNPGLGTPTVLAGYTSGGKGGRAWWCYRYGSESLVLDVRLGRLRNVVFTTAAAQDLARELRSGARRAARVS